MLGNPNTYNVENRYTSRATHIRSAKIQKNPFFAQNLAQNMEIYYKTTLQPLDNVVPFLYYTTLYYNVVDKT